MRCPGEDDARQRAGDGADVGFAEAAGALGGGATADAAGAGWGVRLQPAERTATSAAKIAVTGAGSGGLLRDLW